MTAKRRNGLLGAIGAFFYESDSVSIRPPYASKGETFDACRTCEGMCLNACEEQIIVRDESNRVVLDFSTDGCSYCDRCLEVCTRDVLNDPERFIQGYAKISMPSCLSHQGTICFSCKEPCMENAIVFKGMFEPIVLPEKCTGCGYCLGVCPSQAIAMVSL